MGIDAKILVRGVKTSIVTEEWLTKISWQLCASIGARHFFVSDGLAPDEYQRQTEAWHAKFCAHPLHAQYEAACDRIRADIGEYDLEERRRAIEKTGALYRDDDSPAPGTVYQQDGPDIPARRGECLLEVHVWSRWYGIGYERGDLLTLCAIAEWLEANVPGCEVWYGGDSSGVLAEPWPDSKRRELREHLYSEMGRNYFRHSFMSDNHHGTPKPCGLCPGSEYRGTRFGTGPSYSAFNCAGCGVSMETSDGGKTWTKRKEKE